MNNYYHTLISRPYTSTWTRERYLKILHLRTSGMTYQAICHLEGVSKERIRQALMKGERILKKEIAIGCPSKLQISCWLNIPTSPISYDKNHIPFGEWCA